MYNFSCEVLDVVISDGISRKDKICPVFLRPSAICIWRKGALALCTLTRLSKIDIDYKQCSAPYPDNYISIKIMFNVSSNGALIGDM